MSRTYIRINGLGNAWPVELGKTSIYYQAENFEELSNSSFSLLEFTAEPQAGTQIAEVLIDAGHGVPQYLIQNSNRLPQAVILTHPHIDHCLGVDWVAQSYFRRYARPYPLYASWGCWETLVSSFPFLAKIIDFRRLWPGQTRRIEEVSGLSVSFFPVFHGENAKGAGCVVLDKEGTGKVLISGDLLCPLLRRQDLDSLADVRLFYWDCNNRFPSPATCHWSFSSRVPNSMGRAEQLRAFIATQARLSYLISPHNLAFFSSAHHDYFDCWLNEQAAEPSLDFSILDFHLRLHGPQGARLCPVHFSGSEDVKIYGQAELDRRGLTRWIEKELAQQDLELEVIEPRPGLLTELL